MLLTESVSDQQRILWSLAHGQAAGCSQPDPHEHPPCCDYACLESVKMRMCEAMRRHQQYVAHCGAGGAHKVKLSQKINFAAGY